MAYSNVKGMNPSTVDFKLATLTVSRNSTNQHQELITLADHLSSLGITRVLASPMASTEFGLGVRIISGPSSVSDLAVRAVLSSTQADNVVTIQSPSSGIPVNIVNASASDNDTGAIAGGKSSVTLVIAENFGWNGSTNWQKIEGSTAVAMQGAFGLTVRSGFPRPLTTASTSAFAGSTALSVCASNATVRSKVYAYSITTTNQTATQLGFYAGSTLVWAVRLQALSSAVSGANLAVTPPGYLFENSTGQPITLNTDAASTVAGWTFSAAYFQATD